MATISENLIALNEAKANIKQAIENKGQDLTNVPFTQYAEKINAIQTGGGGESGEYNIKSVVGDDGTQTLEIVTLGSGKIDGLQWVCDNVKGLNSTFKNYKGESLDEPLRGLNTINVTDMGESFYGCSNITSIPPLNTKNVTNMDSMFRGCKSLVNIPPLDTSNVKSSGMTYLFYECSALTEIPQLDTSNVTNMTYLFFGCKNIKTIPVIDTRNVTNMGSMFYGCTNIETIPVIDMINVTSASAILTGCSKLENITFINIKRNITIGSGTSYGHLLTVDSLVNTIKELWDYSSGTTTYTLTMGTANTPKIADIYVKLVDVTEEMLANDPYADQKMPCEVCSSGDEGAMLITDYASLKRWSIS